MWNIAGKVVVGAFAIVGVVATGSKVYDHFSKDESEKDASAAKAA